LGVYFYKNKISCYFISNFVIVRYKSECLNSQIDCLYSVKFIYEWSVWFLLLVVAAMYSTACGLSVMSQVTVFNP